MPDAPSAERPTHVRYLVLGALCTAAVIAYIHRGCLALVRVAKTWAAADGRDHVLPDDVKELAEPVLCHRLLLDAEAQFSGVTIDSVIARLLDNVAPPTDRVA